VVALGVVADGPVEPVDGEGRRVDEAVDAAPALRQAIEAVDVEVSNTCVPWAVVVMVPVTMTMLQGAIACVLA
jgi:hypothetical protein